MIEYVADECGKQIIKLILIIAACAGVAGAMLAVFIYWRVA